MKNIAALIVILPCIAFVSCGKSEKGKVQATSQQVTEARNKEALESLKLIQEREARDAELTERIKNSPLKN